MMCIFYHSLTWSTYQVASRKKGYWEWITSQIKCPCRPQIEDDLCREMIAYPQRILPLDGYSCVNHFSYLIFHGSSCHGCADLKLPGGGVVFVPSVRDHLNPTPQGSACSAALKSCSIHFNSRERENF